MYDRYCPICGFVLFPRPGEAEPPENCPSCEARGMLVRLLATQPRAGLRRHAHQALNPERVGAP